jgi:hypothetical protein
LHSWQPLKMVVETPSPRSPYGTKYKWPRASSPYVGPKPATTYTTSCASHNLTAFAVAIGVFRENKGRSWRRAAHIATLRYLVGKVQNALDIKFGGVTTAGTYAKWAHKSGADVLTDELSEGATLHWIGPRRKDRVFLFLHGMPFFPILRLIGEERTAGPFRWSFCRPGPG